MKSTQCQSKLLGIPILRKIEEKSKLKVAAKHLIEVFCILENARVFLETLIWFYFEMAAKLLFQGKLFKLE